MSILMSNFGRLKLNPNKSFKLALDTFAQKNKQTFTDSHHISKLLDFVRMTNTKLDLDDIDAMAEKYGLTADLVHIEKTIQILSKKIKTPKEIDYTDMLYLPIKMDLNAPTYDVINLDESQDTSGIQLALLEKLLHKDSQLISVGDRWQSIYGFSGADLYSFDKISSRTNTVRLPLSISYRCPLSVVEEARKINPSIEPFSGAKEGLVRDALPEEITHGDMVLSRTTKPLVSLFFYLLDRKIKSRVVGKDLHEHFKELATMLSQFTSNAQALIYLERKADQIFDDVSRLGFPKPEEHKKVVEITETKQIANILLRHVQYPSQLGDLIDKMFSDRIGDVLLMTIHRSKGLEADRVFVVESFDGVRLTPHRMAKTTEAQLQENHLEFVSITRSKDSLFKLHLTTEELE
jgi:superfamily I DNA/RNA helicase